MKIRLPLLAFARPVLFLAVIAFGMSALGGEERAALAVYTISAAFLFVSSSILAGWVPARDWVRSVLAPAELAVVTGVAWMAAVTSGTADEVRTLFIPVSVTLPLILPRRWWWPALGATLAGWLVAGLPDWLATPGFAAAMEMIVFAVAILSAGWVGMLLTRLTEEKERSEALLQDLQASKASLERIHRQLQHSVAQRQAAAVLEERQRLAREIHDSVAHMLTVLTVQIQAGRRLLERSPAEAAETLERCETLSREALIETRRAVRALHQTGLEGQSDFGALTQLGQEFQTATGVVVEVSAEPEAKQLPPDPERLTQLYRIFQEALSNAHRHGGARHVTAHLSLASPNLLSLTIANDGATPEALDGGLGLQSMAERVRGLGGSIRYEPGDPGMRIHLFMPTNREVDR